MQVGKSLAVSQPCRLSLHNLPSNCLFSFRFKTLPCLEPSLLFCKSCPSHSSHSCLPLLNYLYTARLDGLIAVIVNSLSEKEKYTGICVEAVKLERKITNLKIVNHFILEQTLSTELLKCVSGLSNIYQYF